MQNRLLRLYSHPFILISVPDFHWKEPYMHAYGHHNMHGQVLSKPSSPALIHGYPLGLWLCPYIVRLIIRRSHTDPRNHYLEIKVLRGFGYLDLSQGRLRLRMNMFSWLHGLLISWREVQMADLCKPAQLRSGAQIFWVKG